MAQPLSNWGVHRGRTIPRHLHTALQLSRPARHGSGAWNLGSLLALLVCCPGVGCQGQLMAVPLLLPDAVLPWAACSSAGVDKHLYLSSHLNYTCGCYSEVSGRQLRSWYNCQGIRPPGGTISICCFLQSCGAAWPCLRGCMGLQAVHKLWSGVQAMPSKVVQSISTLQQQCIATTEVQCWLFEGQSCSRAGCGVAPGRCLRFVFGAGNELSTLTVFSL